MLATTSGGRGGARQRYNPTSGHGTKGMPQITLAHSPRGTPEALHCPREGGPLAAAQGVIRGGGRHPEERQRPSLKGQAGYTGVGGVKRQGWRGRGGGEEDPTRRKGDAQGASRPLPRCEANRAEARSAEPP
jgi:hypothetical protein